MPQDHRDPTDPRAWLRRARSNLARARITPPTPEILYEDLCFDAQQAAEKAVKAVLVHGSIEFPKTHDLNRLLSLAATQEYQRAVRLADIVVQWAEALIGKASR